MKTVTDLRPGNKQTKVKSCKFEVLGLEVDFEVLDFFNYREVDIKIYNPQKLIIIGVFLSNICFWCVKETSLGDISFTH